LFAIRIVEGAKREDMIERRNLKIVAIGGARAQNQAPEGAACVCLEDSTVSSGLHCVLWESNGSLLVADAGSDNGTWIERDGSPFRVGPRSSPTRLWEGDRVRLGRVVVEVSQTSPPVPS
jgi:hypothetical protein